MAFSSLLSADVLGVSRKRLDNVLIALGKEIAPRGRQGKSRSFSVDQLELLALVLLLQRDLGVSSSRALDLARTLKASEFGVAPLGTLASLHFDMDRLRSVLQQALAGAVEDHVAPRRGRPRTRK
jgi:hypothetical protein